MSKDIPKCHNEDRYISYNYEYKIVRCDND